MQLRKTCKNGSNEVPEMTLGQPPALFFDVAGKITTVAKLCHVDLSCFNPQSNCP